ncbi:MAG TPA: WecB/TagA/CpsF family glycosyltransferase [Candidatus Limnocylindrales bacterium]|nr:WecB/TagA/CpsF family glycosyltransferase [Candidatus Limnocylindrales bacterium]
MTWIGAALIGVPGLLAAGLSLYLLALAFAAFRRPRADAHNATMRSRLAVLVPAHNEEQLIARCVESLRSQSYPRHLYRIVVVADNCTDATAVAALNAGAEVMARHDLSAQGKGRALRWSMDRLLTSDPDLDAVVVVDADSIADPDLLSSLAACFEAGHEVVQGEYLVLAEDGSLRTRLGELAFLLFHRVRLSGRAALGMPASLVGNGMLFGRSTLLAHPWAAYTSVEDLEYSLNLREAGVRPAYAAHARVRGPMAPGYRAGSGQRVRWEGGRLYLARTRILRLVKAAASRRDPSLLDAAVDLAVPPLAAFALIDVAGLGLAAAASALRIAPGWVVATWAFAIVALAGFVLIGLRAGRAPLYLYLALLEVPRFLVWKLVAYARIVGGFDPSSWERTHRKSGGAPAPVEVAGVRIDPLDMDGALAQIQEAIGSSRLLQVTTINLDFLVRAQTNSELRGAFRRSGLNLPDGTPVLWLGRLLGKPVPERVAGADLVPLLARQAAASGSRIFLLGGEQGAAAAAAARLQADHPGLRITGCLEPPRADLDDMDNEGMLAAIREAGADILLVAFGHPKQDLWIDRNRERLPVSVAIGVGCAFDLLAGRQRRAPWWMQKIGLEWLHRLREEPVRLAGRYTTDLGWLPVLTAKVLYQRILARPVSQA